MTAARHALGQDIVKAYKNVMGASEPQEDFDGRNAFYFIQEFFSKFLSLILVELHSKRGFGSTCGRQTAGMWPRCRGVVASAVSDDFPPGFTTNTRNLAR